MRRAICVLGVLLALGASCERARALQSLAECRQAAEAAREEAKAARGARDVKAAAAAQQRAQGAAEAAGRLGPQSGSPAEASGREVVEVQRLAAETRRLARLTADDAHRVEVLGGWKVRAYGGVRGTAVNAVLRALAAAARQMAQVEQGGSVDGQVREAAELGAGLWAVITGQENVAGAPDWNKIAAELEGLPVSYPAGLAQFLAVTWVLSGQNDLALWEIEAANAAGLPDRAAKAQQGTMRGAVLLVNGMPDLGVEQLEVAAQLGGDKQLTEWPRMGGMLYLALAFDHLRNKELLEADADVTQSMRVWPDNPLTVFLTGERLAADGRYEAAAESLEKAAKDSKVQWLASSVAQRAREIRDGQGRQQPLLASPSFLHQAAVNCVGEYGRRGGRSLLALARGFGQRLAGYVPGLPTSGPAT